MFGVCKTVSKRTMAGIMGLMLLAIVLFSVFYIAAETGHNCQGEDCPVCACIQVCDKTLQRMGAGETAAVSVAFPVLFFSLLPFFSVLHIILETPVSEKVRLNN